MTDWTVMVVVTFLAAVVNGALGYGFSSLTVPVALLYYSNRSLNPALVVIELFVNAYVLIINRQCLPHIWKRILPIVVGVAPGVLVGSLLLTSISPGWTKLITYSLILPLILLQAAGYRRYLTAERAVAVPFGAGIGVLYSLTTISGPPLALLLNNQGYVKSEFRASLAVIRIAESSLTTIAYMYLGLFAAPATRQILHMIVPGVLLGIPLGAYLIRHLEAETFRRICMSFDAWIVGFGLSRTVIEIGLLPSPTAFCVLGGTVLVDAYLLRSYFIARRSVVDEAPTAIRGEI